MKAMPSAIKKTGLVAVIRPTTPTSASAISIHRHPLIIARRLYCRRVRSFTPKSSRRQPIVAHLISHGQTSAERREVAPAAWRRQVGTDNFLGFDFRNRGQWRAVSCNHTPEAGHAPLPIAASCNSGSIARTGRYYRSRVCPTV
jgi:hypothetical protein